MKKLLISILIANAFALNGLAADSMPLSKVSKSVDENALNTITIAPAGVKSLRIKLAGVTSENVVVESLYPAKILPASGAGDFIITDESFTPTSKHAIAQKQIAADEKIDIQKARLDEAKKSLARVEKLARENISSQREVEQQQSLVATAQASLDAAIKERRLLDVDSSQFVALVKIYAGDISNIDTQAAVRIVDPNGSAKNINLIATPGGAKSFSEGAVINLIYKLPPNPPNVSAGQSAGALVKTKDSGRFLCVPGNSIITDIYGNDYVYIKVAENTYARKRVEVRQRLGDKAVISKGLKGDEEVVTDGAAEVFGAEFGFGN
jgi:multidrug efflux pump subunit AcrA (membrane-fusion protein)